jgi:ferredoxin
VDDDECAGFGACVEHMPELFAFDDWGYGKVVGDGEVQPGHEEKGRLAIDACPARAIHEVRTAGDGRGAERNE